MSGIDYIEFDNPQQNFLAGLGWEAKPVKKGSFFSESHDLDLCCCMMSKEFNLIDFISPTDLKKKDYQFQILHTGDHKTGNSPGEDEELHFNLRKLAPEIFYIVFIVRIKGDTSFQDIEKSYCIYMDGGSYRSFLKTEINEPSQNEGGQKIQYVSAVLKRWTGKSLDGDFWSLNPIEKFIPATENKIESDFLEIKPIIEGIYGQ
ncbi:MAG: TerD family protein [Alphaproteobacteria bacterium]|nr:TerD family protein [Alphaproteobacteria bacterium]